jgi:hypothetical protein
MYVSRYVSGGVHVLASSSLRMYSNDGIAEDTETEMVACFMRRACVASG